MAGKILVVDDEPTIREMIAFALSRAGFAYIEAADAGQAETEIMREIPDMILLDWMLPGRSGIEFVKALRSDPDTRSIPVIMLTAREGEDDKVRGLKDGADDYISKPFAPKELVARIEAVLRRVKPEATNEAVTVQGLLLDPMSHRVTVNQQDLDLGPTEFRLLHLFMTHPDRVYSRQQLLDLVWGSNIHVGPRTVDMHVSKLRKALEMHGYQRLIQTVRSSGYRLSARGPL
ncbi:MAG: phosphate regulon transcriptional regulator PhoB [Kiloniellales bacterium]|nr:phosphate regulon transcriptional regulator PhoB [Kiloniellales bacterium]